MRLLYIHSRPIDYGKADTIQVLSMCQAFSDIGIETTLVVPRRKFERNQTSDKYIKSNFGYDIGFKVIEKGISPDKKILKYISSKYIDEVITEINPTVCYVRDIRILLQCSKREVPIIYENHNHIMHIRSSLANNYFKMRLKTIAGKSSFLKLVTISDKIKEYWISEGIPSEKIISYHDGFIGSAYKNIIPTDEARKNLGLSINNKLVVYTGSLLYDIDKTLLELVRTLKHVTFFIIGGPKEKALELDRIISKERLNNVVITGPIPYREIPNYQFSADVLLAIWSGKVPHIDGISPLKLFEYMASGKVIVAHAFPTIKEVLYDEYNALLVNPDSMDDLIDRVKKAIDMDYPNSIADNARTDAFENYTWEKRAYNIIQSINNK